MRERARAEVGFTREMQDEVTRLIRAMTPDDFDRYCDAVPDTHWPVTGDTADAWYASHVASYQGDMAHYHALKAYLEKTKEQ